MCIFKTFSQTSNALPKTSYFKLIDVWLFFSIVIIFVVILLQTLVNFSNQNASADHSCLGKFINKLVHGHTKQFQRPVATDEVPDEGFKAGSDNHLTRQSTYDQESHPVNPFNKNNTETSRTHNIYFPRNEDVVLYERPNLRQRETHSGIVKQTGSESKRQESDLREPRRRKRRLGSWLSQAERKGPHDTNNWGVSDQERGEEEGEKEKSRTSTKKRI
ncbi:putative glutamate-gated chloride channel alpha-like 5 [Homarus americanus]|uniref:Putative glutamate-gated chloride channel alpha-like 5 n=1 Tax=Homarus americanus TaxID=6706 RepID=A0A8J5MXA3_HOMAM|nr:putative glutamate-gated chloride channel alpha-like 5 [Homarus americanus]